jgi:hypothetical protein
MRRTGILIIGALVATVLPAAAQDAPAPALDGVDGEAEYQKADDYDLDLFAQPGPALLSLDVATRRAAAPSTPKDFGYDIGSVGGPDGDQYGLAMSVSPYWIGDRRITLEEYRNDTSEFERIYARSEVSLGGSYISADGAHAWRLAAAAQTQLLDRQDHRYDRAAFDCLHEAWNRLRRGAHERTIQDIARALAEEPSVSEETLLEMQESALAGSAGADAFEAARRQCQDESAARLIAKASWLVGAGVGLRSDQNRFAGFDYDGASAWTQYRQPLTDNGRFALFAIARGDWGRAFDIGMPAPVKARAYEAGGGLAWQTTRFRIDVSASYNRRDYRGAVADDDFIRYAAVADIRLRRGIWLEGSVGFIDQSIYSDGAFGGAALKIDWSDFRRMF